jgi:hypothetical protein
MTAKDVGCDGGGSAPFSNSYGGSDKQKAEHARLDRGWDGKQQQQILLSCFACLRCDKDAA